jgi:excinuclease UvrABC helicase subunit UvrB
VYRECVQDLVMRCFDGYNAAVLAYGQTGSGKTYTMGTSNVGVADFELGIIPRVIHMLFDEV